MNFAKNIFLLIVSPTNGWSEIKRFNVPAQILLSKVFYPLLAIIALTSFIQFFYGISNSLQYFIQISIITFVKFFFGYLLCIYIMSGLFRNLVENKDSENKLQLFIIYNYCILILLGILKNFLPVALTFLDIFPLYIIYVVWKGVDYIGIEGNPFKFVAIASIAILLSPFIIKHILTYLLPL